MRGRKGEGDLANPPSQQSEGGGPIGQSVVMMAPTTSACAANTSIVLAAVSNMRMWGLQYRIVR